MLTSDNNAAELDDPDYRHKRTRSLESFNPPKATTAIGISSRYTGFKLPEGWGVEEVPRSGSATVDKYYYEPGTGRKFRSLKAVERHINGEEAEFTHRTRAITWHNNDHDKGPTRYRKMIICGGKVVKLTEDALNKSPLPIIASSGTASNSSYNLPDGWVVEEVPRSNGSHTDKYYYEPETGRKFRSLTAAQRHAAELNEDLPLSALVEEIKDMNKPLFKTIKSCRRVKKPSSCNKMSTETSDQTSSFVTLPEKVEWVLDSHRGDEWKPFVCDRAIPDSVKEQWKERFQLAMNVDSPDVVNSKALG